MYRNLNSKRIHSKIKEKKGDILHEFDSVEKSALLGIEKQSADRHSH